MANSGNAPSKGALATFGVLGALGALGAPAACSGRDVELAADASLPADAPLPSLVRVEPARPSVRAEAVVARFGEWTSMRERLGRGGALAAADGGFRLARGLAPSARAVPAGGASLDVRLPARADGVVRIARADRPGVSLEIETAVGSAAGEVVEGAVVYPSTDWDLVQSFDGLRVEELRLLRTASAAEKASWTLRPGPAVTAVRLRDGRVEVLEGEEVRLVSTALFAVDARGTTRTPTSSLVREGAAYVLTASLDVRDLTLPIALDPGWTATFNHLATNHADTAAVTLGDGRVAVFPGWGSPGSAPPDLYDPLTDRWSVGPVAFGQRDGSMPLWLPVQKRVLFAGGQFGIANTYELWDPVTGTSSGTKPLGAVFDRPVLLTLPNGKVIAVSAVGDDTAIYDPALDVWTRSTNSGWGRNGAAVVLLKSGKVLVSGSCCNTAQARIYDPTTDTWAVIPNMNGARSGHSMNLLPSGKVLLTGSDSGGGINAEIYDETANTWTARATPRPIGGHRTISLPTGKVLVVNNANSTDTLVFDETTGWSDGPKMSMRRDTTALALLSGGRVLAAGGNGGSLGVDSSQNTAEVLVLSAKTCAGVADCGGGPCVDGYCCDRGCTETCSACDVAGREGFCSPLSGAPHGARSCAPYASCYGGACLTKCTTTADCVAGLACIYGSCATKLAQGTACFTASDCASGNCADGVCCDAACGDQCKACDVPGSVGTCTAVVGAPHGARTSCAPYTCAAGACKTTCAADGDCTNGTYCSGGACVIAQVNGKSCTGNAQCTSGYCVDGYCCNSACGAPCNTCAKASKLGVCSLVAAGDPDPRGACQGECANGCIATGCQWKPATTVCGGSCLGSLLTSGGRCTGTSEVCSGAVATTCAGALKCLDAKSCKGSCSADADCTTGACDVLSGACVTPVVDAGVDAAGADAGADAAAEAGAEAAADTAAEAEAAADTATAADTAADAPLPPGDGEPAAGWPHGDATPVEPASVHRCAFDAECETGFCVEGVCCDQRCDAPCHSCAMLTAPGKCTLEPYGVDLKQSCGRALDCFATCGGAGQCVGAGPGVMCARNRCTGPSAGVGAAFCAAAGQACPTAEGVGFECGAYGCDPAFGACRTVCTTSDDCAPGNLCDPESQRCAPPPPAPESSGCDVGLAGDVAGGTQGRAILAAVGAALAIVVTRRRRRR
jgi:hypothetical protein